MAESPTKTYRSDEQFPQSVGKHESVMRRFLESGVDFTWPSDLGECSGNHCDLRLDLEGIPLLWKKKISDKKASIDMYEAHPNFNFGFKEAFVVKTIRESSSKKAREIAANEVNTMRDLRHPHVTALLGTFMYQERLNILIFPAACCDLHQYMKQISRDFQFLRAQSHHTEVLSRVASRSDGTNTPDSTTSSTRNRHGPETIENRKGSTSHRTSQTEAWPIKLSFQEKLDLLRRYFVCLSQALSYLHESDVRHKDIKPENILIDDSGSVILTDFGISRRFPKHSSHITNTDWKFTRKYASPEIMKGKRVPRDDPSDVFSLGCVFLEMATLLLGWNLSNFSDHYTTTVNDSGKEEAYHCNLGRVHSWIDYLRSSNASKLVHMLPLQAAQVESQDLTACQNGIMVEALIHIRGMLDENPQSRPKSQGLWKHFQFISPQKCRDCDPRNGEMWKPSVRQQQDAETGLIKRRSLISGEAVSLGSSEHGRYGDIDSTLLSVPTLPDRAMGLQRVSSATRSLHNFDTKDYMKAVSQPASPPQRRNLENRGSNLRASRSSSPKMRRIQNMSGDTSPHDFQDSTYNSPIDSQDQPSDLLYKTSNHIESTTPSPLSHKVSPQAARDDIMAQLEEKIPHTSRHDTQLFQASIPGRFDRRRDNTKAPAQDAPPLDAQIIVYDVKLRMAYQTVFAPIKGLFNHCDRV